MFLHFFFCLSSPTHCLAFLLLQSVTGATDSSQFGGNLAGMLTIYPGVYSFPTSVASSAPSLLADPADPTPSLSSRVLALFPPPPPSFILLVPPPVNWSPLSSSVISRLFAFPLHFEDRLLSKPFCQGMCSSSL